MSPPENSVNKNYSNKGRGWEIRFTSIDPAKSPSQFAPSPALRANLSTTAALDAPDLVCLSHLRWNFVYQRPQHLLGRCAKNRRVFFVEEPVFSAATDWRLDVSIHETGVWVIVPHLSEGIGEETAKTAQQAMLDDLFQAAEISQYILWYYTPMAVSFTNHLKPLSVVYDCMDELSAFQGAHPELKANETQLLKRANVVFTGGHSLYEAKQHQHPNIHAFPSSIEKEHFATARNLSEEPADQKDIPHPRLGFYGVVDERMDIELLGGIAAARPDWHLVIIGPVVKIDPATLPTHPNIHYLGGKSYQELPGYLGGWDIAMLPFAINESTKFISPTKTPEYLAAGKPVISTPIRDVVRPYGENNLVRIASNVAEFVAAAEEIMGETSDDRTKWLGEVDAFLADNSWDNTWGEMLGLIESAIEVRRKKSLVSSH
ncbi:MAG: glycosyltransferase family 1 protein [Microcoleus sp. PH2017_10_PVI_O_A]|uniref:glycosyltransferase family 1 protein n=1 Tax=unclassified Microcoleus TaxID=2642155 RepID=UPI001D4DABAD|nr:MULTISPECIES: glycosyltransferase family 1 protein [unclassified Microcoleus]TAE76672.1 MAG: glycosyltransferase family 1 protein [Oscillatoriales cyanobacterium]MCC3409255.1 glycosyltransferase family 1 protein [Microcoleus sp. PH2017_10_PVI_O_A]MCC3463488.1 glycosyltransferase family 1 protein [Microcoleus sp. PH2017_11_PCY_U_A]MCC3481843.1 glycosyltransferase family 1 protein [Microcoleus sp. PH2017_12_PCY_D_A]MCC3562773.1 glycosyltransferase family 1 protein [Microcoleus sp. PH2017_27_L